MGNGFEGGSLWMKLIVIFTGLALTLDLFSAAAPGWSSSHGKNIVKFNSIVDADVIGVINSIKAVDALGVIGFLSVLIAFVLTLCLVLLDLKSAVKIVLIIISIFSFIAGNLYFFYFFYIIFSQTSTLAKP